MKNILIIVDMQKGFARNDNTRQISDRIKKLLKRDLFDAVIATRFFNDDNSMYEKMFGWKRLKSEDDRSLPKEIGEYVNYYADKYIYNCVNASFLQRLCQLNEGVYPEKVFLVGADTDCCVMTIATSLFEHNIRPIVLTQYVASNGGTESHEAGILVMRRLIGNEQLSDKDPLTRDELSEL